MQSLHSQVIDDLNNLVILFSTLVFINLEKLQIDRVVHWQVLCYLNIDIIFNFLCKLFIKATFD